jgi:hypothetical protein
MFTLRSDDIKAATMKTMQDRMKKRMKMRTTKDDEDDEGFRCR